MGQPGAKKNDQIVSATPGDVHIIMVPSPGGPVPTPIPHPCASIINDKVAEKVVVMGQPGAVKGSKSKHTPPHIPMGPGPFQKPPKNEGKIITGSANVFYEGKEAAMLGDTAEMCSDPSDTPVGKVIGTAATVLVGGGGAGSDAAREQASAKAMAAAGAACHQWINANMPQGPERERAHRDVCTATGHPIDVATGKMFTRNIDLELPGRNPIEFIRNYSSARRDVGPFGVSWRHSYQRELVVHRDFVAHRDPNGRFLEFEPIEVGASAWNQLGRLTLRRRRDGYEVEHPDGIRESYPFAGEIDTAAALIPVALIEDAWGNPIRLDYAKGRLTSLRDAAGNHVALDYNDRGLIVALRLLRGPRRDADLVLRRYRYSDAGGLIEWRDELDHPYRFEYDGYLLTRETDRAGFSFYFSYDAEGWCTSTWGDEGIFARRIEYDRKKLRTRVTDSEGRSKLFHWTPLGVVEREIGHAGDTWRFEYDASLNPVRVEGPGGNIWSSMYDATGRLVATVDPEGNQTAAEWSEDGALTYTDARGETWRRAIQPGGLITHCLDPHGELQIEMRNERGDLIRIQHAGGGETRCSYDDQGNLVDIQLPSGLRIRREYSRRGELVSESDQLGPRFAAEYDARGDRVRVWQRSRGSTQLEYDPERRVRAAVDAKDRRTEYTYARFDRLVAVKLPPVTLADGSVRRASRRFEYDNENRVTSLIDASGQVTSFRYDGHTRPSEIHYPGGRVQRYERNDRGFIAKFVENDELVFEQEVDSRGNVLVRRTGDGQTFHYEYDAAGNVLAAECAGRAGAVHQAFDATGRKTAEHGAFASHELEYRRGLFDVVSHWNGDLDLHLQLAPEGDTTRLQIARGASTDLALSYDARSRLRVAEFASGERQEWTYENWDTSTAQMLRSPDGGVVTRQFSYDAEGWLEKVEDSESGERRFRRDEWNRLVAMETVGDGRTQHFAWGFDAHANRSRATGPDGTEYSATFAGGNRLARVGSDRVEYDRRGRVQSITSANGDRTRFEWDSLSHLTRVVRPDGSDIAMSYDAFGRRIEKTTREGSTQFAWNGDRLISERRSDGEERYYVYQGDSFRPLVCYRRAEAGTWTLFTFACDLNGAPIRMSDSAGAVVWKSGEAPWGDAAPELEQIDQPIVAPGQYRDLETGLHYNFARYYHPQSGVYLSPDPIGVAGGDNAYAYAADPVCWSDPRGLSGADYRDASEKLPQLRGRSEAEVRQILQDNGFTQTRVSNSAARNETWDHPDGSQVRVHPYGNESDTMRNGNLTPKSGLNAHVHKENSAGDQLTDRGIASNNPDETHIGIKNPSNLPNVRNGRPHGHGA